MGRNERAFAIPMISGLIGVVMALIIQYFYDEGIVIDELITATIVLREIQAIIIVTWIILGIALAASQN